jgi:hypothetical protein
MTASLAFGGDDDGNEIGAEEVAMVPPFSEAVVPSDQGGGCTYAL